MIDFLGDFAEDSEFSKLLGRRDDEVDLTRAALELARDAYPNLSFDPVLNWVAERAGELSGPIARASGDEAILRALTDCLAGRFEITGSPEAYETPDGSYLNRVIETRTGIPICLAVLYLAVADKAGIGLRGVCAPGHFLTRYDTLHKPFFIDAYHGGRILTLAECIERLVTEHDLTKPQARKALEGTGPRPIVARMLNNLKAITAKVENWKLCWKVQHRLLALNPSASSERRDWALVSLKAGRPGPALTMLEQCLKNCPEEERAILREHANKAKGAVSAFN